MRKLVLLFLLFLASCGKVTEEKRAELARENYLQGMSAYARKDYGGAINRLTEALKYVENLSPEEIKSAKYALGESYYMRRDYVNAIVYLEEFLFYYPESSEAERVYFMVVESYMKVAPDAHRDQSYTFRAIDRAREFLNRYPNSSYRDKVVELIEEAERKIARHEYLVARFYEDLGYHYSASLRYRYLLTNHAGQVSETEVLYRYLKSLLLVREQAKRQEAKYRQWIESAKKELAKAVSEEEKRAVQKRIEFFQKEIDRWNRLAEESYREGLKGMKTYREVYGENAYYKELTKYAR